jgi:hypothetical protein
MRMSRLAFAAAFSLLLAPLSAVAQGKGAGELWEITMNIPGMPAGMMKPQRVCQGDDPSRAATQDPSKKDCKVTGTKKTALGTTVILSCPDGSTMTIDQQYTSAARTEFKSTMTSKGGKQGDFQMNMTGRKVGACDAVAENKARDAKIDDMKKQAAAGAAAGAAAMKQQSDNQIKQCSVALEKMDFHGFGLHGHCYKRSDGQCATAADMHKQFPEATKACNANISEYCKRFQSAEGFMKVRTKEETAKTCGVTTAAIKAAQCPRVAKSQSPLSFLGAYCPVEAKPIAMEHCTGRDYTSRSGGKYAAFCDNYLANADFERPPGAPARAASGTVPGSSDGAPASSGNQTQGQKSADAVKEGVSQGINKLRGLFGK